MNSHSHPWEWCCCCVCFTGKLRHGAGQSCHLPGRREVEAELESEARLPDPSAPRSSCSTSLRASDTVVPSEKGAESAGDAACPKAVLLVACELGLLGSYMGERRSGHCEHSCTLGEGRR